ncbi:MAG: nucleoside-triphosphatase [Methanobacteriota archaeon]
MHLVLIGRPGAGKTMLCAEVARLLGSRAGGVVMPRIYENGRLVGYKIRDVASGREAPLARKDWDAGMTLGPYRLRGAAFHDVGVPAMNEALAKAAVLVVDEVGPLTQVEARFNMLVETAAEDPRPALFGINDPDGTALERYVAQHGTAFRVEPGHDLGSYARTLAEMLAEE